MNGFALLSLGIALATPPAEIPTSAPKPAHISASLFESRLRLCRSSPAQKRGCLAAFQYLAQLTGEARAPASLQTDLPSELARIEQRLQAKKIAEDDWVAGAFNAWLQSLDPHAKLMAAEEEDRRASADKIVVQGAGAKLRFHHGKVFVGYNMDGSAAESMGLRPGDEVLAVNGRSLAAMSESTKRKILSEAPAPYRLRVRRDQQELEITVSEKRYVLANVEGRVEKTAGGKEGLLRIRSFDKDNTCAEVKEALARFEQEKVSRIQLDLSNNPGGLVREAMCAAGLFIGSGKVFAKLRKKPNPEAEQLIPAKPLRSLIDDEPESVLRTTTEQSTKAPLVVEINQNTASAAEMLAAALQDLGRAQLRGARSFGKGSMQSVFHPWDDPKLYLTLTTHQIYRPSGATIQYLGVTPDQVLSRVEGENFPRERELTL